MIVLYGTNDITFVKGCTGDERELANYIVKAVSPGREPEKVYEGKETQEFWDSLGGQTAYASGKMLEEQTPSHEPRLFQCSNASGRFFVEEIFDFSQEVRRYMNLYINVFLYVLSLMYYFC